MMMPKEIDELINKKTCISCAVLTPDTFCFTMAWSYEEEIEKYGPVLYYLIYRLPKPGTNEPAWTKMYTIEDTSHYSSLATNPNALELVMLTRGKDIMFHQASHDPEFEEIVDLYCVPYRIKYIGNHYYVAGSWRTVIRRDGPSKWTHISREICDKSLNSFKAGFEDLDGFSEDDIYAVGGKGDAWHYDGKKWELVDVPTNVSLESVCCASDGNVYIGGQYHTVLRGRGDRWEIINKIEHNYFLNHIVEYKEGIFTVDEWGRYIFVVTPKGLEVGKYEGCSSLCLAVGHGLLLAAGSEEAAIFDGKKWTQLFVPKK